MALQMYSAFLCSCISPALLIWLGSSDVASYIVFITFHIYLFVKMYHIHTVLWFLPLGRKAEGVLL